MPEVLGPRAISVSEKCFQRGNRALDSSLQFIWEGQTGYHFPRRVWQGGYPSRELFATWNKIAQGHKASPKGKTWMGWRAQSVSDSSPPPSLHSRTTKKL